MVKVEAIQGGFNTQMHILKKMHEDVMCILVQYTLSELVNATEMIA